MRLVLPHVDLSQSDREHEEATSDQVSVVEAKEADVIVELLAGPDVLPSQPVSG